MIVPNIDIIFEGLKRGIIGLAYLVVVFFFFLLRQ